MALHIVAMVIIIAGICAVINGTYCAIVNNKL